MKQDERPQWLTDFINVLIGLFSVFLALAGGDFLAKQHNIPVYVGFWALVLLVAVGAVSWQAWRSKQPIIIAALIASIILEDLWWRTLVLVLIGAAWVVAWLWRRNQAAFAGLIAVIVLWFLWPRAWDGFDIWRRFHRLTYPQASVVVSPDQLGPGDKYHVTVQLDDDTRNAPHDCVWDDPVASPQPFTGECETQPTVRADFPTQTESRPRISVTVRVRETPLIATQSDPVTISNRQVDLSLDRHQVTAGGPSVTLGVTVNGHTPPKGIVCQWMINGQPRPDERCNESYQGDITPDPGGYIRVPVGVVVKGPNWERTLKDTIIVTRPAQYVAYVLDASGRTAVQVGEATILDQIRRRVSDRMQNLQTLGAFASIRTFGNLAAPHDTCDDNRVDQLPFGPLILERARSIIKGIQPGATTQAPLLATMEDGIQDLGPVLNQANDPGTIVALITITLGGDTCAAKQLDQVAVAGRLRNIIAKAGSMRVWEDFDIIGLTIGVGLTPDAANYWDRQEVMAGQPYSLIVVHDQTDLARVAAGITDFLSDSVPYQKEGCTILVKLGANGTSIENLKRYCQRHGLW